MVAATVTTRRAGTLVTVGLIWVLTPPIRPNAACGGELAEEGSPLPAGRGRGGGID